MNAERSLYGKKNCILNILNSPQVDSRDFYPLEMLLQAEYVLVINPFQYHLTPVEQDVVKSVFDLFTENLEIAKDFVSIFQSSSDQLFDLQVYQRYQPTSLDRALRTLQYMQFKIGKPGSQLEWMLVSSPLPAILSEDTDGRHVVQANIINHHSAKSNPSILYVGEMPDTISIEGKVISETNLCSGSTLRFTTLTKQMDILDRINSIHSFQKPPDFKVTLRGQNQAYLLLEILSNQTQNNNTANACLVVIDKLKVQKLQ